MQTREYAPQSKRKTKFTCVMETKRKLALHQNYKE